MTGRYYPYSGQDSHLTGRNLLLTIKNYRVIQTKGTKMPKYISEERLRNIEKYYTARGISPIVPIGDLIRECQELHEPWMTLDEFLRSGFNGTCWVYTSSGHVYTAYYAKDGQFYESDFTECRLDRNTISRVIPLHKPELPR